MRKTIRFAPRQETENASTYENPTASITGAPLTSSASTTTTAKPAKRQRQSTMLNIYQISTNVTSIPSSIQIQTQTTESPLNLCNELPSETLEHPLAEPLTAPCTPTNIATPSISPNNMTKTEPNHNQLQQRQGILSERARKPNIGSRANHDKNANLESGKRKCHKYGMRKRRKICYREIDDEMSDEPVDNTYTFNSIT